MNKVFLAATATAIALLCLSDLAWAVTIDNVLVGNAGNAADTRYSALGHGSVSYNYSIGKYEVTAGQYTAFLNAVAATDTQGLYNSNMWSDAYGCKIQQSGVSGSYSYTVAADWANRPVNYVSYWDCCRFANWLGNGQLTGAQDTSTTERGGYTLDGYNGMDGRTIERNIGAKWAVSSEDEWYKAAYYKGGGLNTGYWDYATQSDTAPGHDTADVSGNNSNYYDYYTQSYSIGSPFYRTEVGEFQNSGSAYGTFDQNGNVCEWTEAIRSGAYRIMRGGSFGNYDSSLVARSISFNYPTFESSDTGFRVAYFENGWQPVPEPSSLIALLGGLGAIFGFRRRR